MSFFRSGSVSSRLRSGLSVGAIFLGTLALGPGVQANQPLVAGAVTQASTIGAGISIQNLDSTAGSAQIDYYSPGGNTPVGSQVVTLPASGNVSIFPITAVPAGFLGSAVVRSSNNVTAIVNLLGSNPTIGEAYDGVPLTSIATTAFAPIFQQNNAGYTSSLYVQNTSDTLTNPITVKFNLNGVVVSTQTTTLPPNGSITYDATNDGLGTGKFVGSATVTGSQPVAVVVNQTNGTQLFSQTASAAGGPTLYAPLLMENNGGFSTSLMVQNASTTTSTTISLYLNGSPTPAASVALGPGQSQAWYPIPGTSLPGPKFVGSGVVKSSPAVPLVGSVNQLNSGSGQASAYSAFMSGTQTVNFPLVMWNNSTFYTGENVQNIGTAAATVDLFLNGTIIANQTQVIQPGQSYNWFHPQSNDLLGAVNVAAIQAKAREAGSLLVGVVNEVTIPQAPGDTFFTYEGTNQ